MPALRLAQLVFPPAVFLQPVRLVDGPRDHETKGEDVNNWPLVLPHAHVSRILKHNANRLILTSQVRLGTYDVQDAMTVRRNERKRKTGRFSEQERASVFAIKITDMTEMVLAGLDLAIVRAAGFKTQRDFFDDWLERRNWIDLTEMVRVCVFVFEAPERYLHEKVARGYTTNPAEGARGEPAALSAAELHGLVAASSRRWERERAEELRAERARSLRLRIRRAADEGDMDLVRVLSYQLEDLAADHRAA